MGVTIFGLTNLHGGEFITLISPLFMYLLLSKVSGLPMLEAKADRVWGTDP
ncbi:MAG: DUF1295 domain-containing protein [Bdellovibrionales bacterium]|nr:DUF1295 domain-containing protein [Bdellovibrionales bacterium]